MNKLTCPFRRDVRRRGTDEIATCDLVLRVIRSEDHSQATVHRAACEYCCDGDSPRIDRLVTVFPSLVYRAFQQQQDRSESDQQLLQWAEAAIDSKRPVVPKLCGCDVICIVSDDQQTTHAAIESILQQRDCVVALHLVGVSPQSMSALDRYQENAGVTIHRDLFDLRDEAIAHGDRISIAMRSFHRLTPKLRMPYAAFQFSGTASEPFRLAQAIDTLDKNGAEIFAAAVDADGRTLTSIASDSDGFAPDLRTETTVFRRATFVDMGGIMDLATDEDIEFYRRCVLEGRRIIVDDRIAVRGIGDCDWITERRSVGTNIDYDDARVYSRQAIGFVGQPQRCDVVLPFRGHLEMVQEAMEGLLAQTNIDCVIHLMDDASEEDVKPLFSKYAAHSSVRLYRNRENIGQFISVNNAFPFLETDYLAIHDGDDISIPNRLSASTHALDISGADLFGAAVELFGDEDAFQQTAHESTQISGATVWLRNSFYPKRALVAYYLENPTVVMRKSLFERLGGYADYGSLFRNRTGLDTEFMVRAYFAGAQIAVSREILVKYRCHRKSATRQSETGWDSQAREQAGFITRERHDRMLGSTFDPRMFGSLGQHTGMTVPIAKTEFL